MTYSPAATPPTVAIVYAPDGTEYDRCWTWEAGQNYALHGYQVTAIADDGPMTVERAQALYDADQAAFEDCFNRRGPF